MEAQTAGTAGTDDFVYLDDVRVPDTLAFFDRPLPFDSAYLREKVAYMLPEVREFARPWGAFSVCRPEIQGADRLTVGGRTFTSPLLVRELGGLPEVFPFLASEGRELAAWAASVDEDMRKAAFAVRFIALKEAEEALERLIAERWGVADISAVAPGTLEEWPQSEQRPLLDLMGPAAERKGMILNSKLWLEPLVSSSGIYFNSPSGFHNCYLCRDDDCQWRRFARRE
ncbi:MAG: hypothetical protein LBT40_15065 [Deltaproteobacteria bacterium]|jgi:hypothetical protein|nr:hypothetical protein [Deltaproteobacteria bacterium]